MLNMVDLGLYLSQRAAVRIYSSPSYTQVLSHKRCDYGQPIAFLPSQVFRFHPGEADGAEASRRQGRLIRQKHSSIKL